MLKSRSLMVFFSLVILRQFLEIIFVCDVMGSFCLHCDSFKEAILPRLFLKTIFPKFITPVCCRVISCQNVYFILLRQNISALHCSCRLSPSCVNTARLQLLWFS